MAHATPENRNPSHHHRIQKSRTCPLPLWIPHFPHRKISLPPALIPRWFPASLLSAYRCNTELPSQDGRYGAQNLGCDLYKARERAWAEGAPDGFRHLYYRLIAVIVLDLHRIQLIFGGIFLEISSLFPCPFFTARITNIPGENGSRYAVIKGFREKYQKDIEETLHSLIGNSWNLSFPEHLGGVKVTGFSEGCIPTAFESPPSL